MPLLVFLTLLLSLFAGTLAYGQSARSTTLDSAEAITVEALPAAPSPFREGLFGSVRLWRESMRGQRARQGCRLAFHVRLGHRFSITIAKH